MLLRAITTLHEPCSQGNKIIVIIGILFIHITYIHALVTSKFVQLQRTKLSKFTQAICRRLLVYRNVCRYKDAAMERNNRE